MASERAQVIVVSHASNLVAALQEAGARRIVLTKELGETAIEGQERFTWNWPVR